MLDETVSFAMDWKNGALHAAHAYICENGPRQGSHILATAKVNLDLDCQRSTPSSRPSRCITKSRQLTVDTRPEAVATNTLCTPNASGWEVRGYSTLTSSGAQGTITQPLVVRSLASNVTFNCVQSKAPEGSKVVQGSCTSVGGQSGSNTSLTFSFDPDVRILTLVQTEACSGAGAVNGSTEVVTRGAGHVPFSCLPTSAASCEAEAVFWIGGQPGPQ
ncbi:hypothetical protein B0T16DRAFT_411036 [Cercophora newfieldiana]|uniref:Uncharacterized protein n=1 Tax=Cercophora newfieldiana TaxID=92897 RepID=A0AA39YCA7_9PEZI|nr:hypothetical protein B0T16DRAFT_411036 [Cercophora newfieldiana]